MNPRLAMRPSSVTAMNHSADPRVLGTIAMPGVAVAVWQRQPDPPWQEWLDALPAQRLPVLRQTLRPCDAVAAVTAACDSAALTAGHHRQSLIADVAQLTLLAAGHLGALMVNLRLEVTDGQSCPKWHLDSVRARLLCTLRGAGTQFGPAVGPAQVGAVHQMPTGAVGLFRGKGWPRDGSAILHRSPPAIAGQTRLLVVVDPVDEMASC